MKPRPYSSQVYNKTPPREKYNNFYVKRPISYKSNLTGKPYQGFYEGNKRKEDVGDGDRSSRITSQEKKFYSRTKKTGEFRPNF